MNAQVSVISEFPLFFPAVSIPKFSADFFDFSQGSP
jgi:hypothetical protein